LNDFSFGEAKIGEKQSRQSNSKFDFMQYVFFKTAYAVHNEVWGLPQKLGEFSKIFVLKVTLQSVKFLFNCELQKKWGAG